MNETETIETRKIRSELFVLGYLWIFVLIMKFVVFYILSTCELLSGKLHAGAVCERSKVHDDGAVCVKPSPTTAWMESKRDTAS